MNKAVVQTAGRNSLPSFRMAVLIATLALSGCWESEVEKAEKEYRLIKKTPLAEAQLCEAAIKVRDAHLRAGNEREYELWTIFAQTDCSRSRF